MGVALPTANDTGSTVRRTGPGVNSKHGELSDASTTLKGKTLLQFKLKGTLQREGDCVTSDLT